MKNCSLFLLSLIILLGACDRENYENELITEVGGVPVVNVESSVLGVVIDENKLPVEGATVSLGNVILGTNREGLFQIDEALMNAKGTLIKVEKVGYFTGYKKFLPELETLNYLTIQLLPLDEIETVQSNAESIVNLAGGASVKFSPNSFAQINASQEEVPYQGPVNVQAKWLNPLDPDLPLHLPGDLQGINEEEERVVLTTMGMIAVELLAIDGTTVQLKSGATAELRFPIVDEQALYAPDRIPLWYFDEVAGIWIEEGEAVKQGNQYIGTVSHFSFWNCDVPFPLVFMEGRLVDKSQQPLANVLLTITNPMGLSGYGFTNYDGMFGGYVPQDEVLNLEILFECSYVFSMSIGPFATDINLGDIEIEGPNIESYEIFGTVNDCDGEAVEHGVIELEYANEKVWYAFEDGSFSFTRNMCNVDYVVLTAYDNENFTKSFSSDFAVEPIINAGVFSTCEDIQEQIRITANGEEYLILGDLWASQQSTGDIETPYETFISGSVPWENSTAIFSFTNFTPGPIPIEDVNMQYINLPYPSDEDGVYTLCHLAEGDCQLEEFIIYEYGEVGEKISGEFSGTFNFFRGTLVWANMPVKVQFSVIRD